MAAEVFVWGTSLPVTNVPPDATNLISISGGDYRGVGLKRDGTVLSWGSPNWQQVIYGITNVPIGLTNVVSVAAGAAHTLALRADGSLAMWGAIVGYTGLPPFTTTISPEATNVVALAQGTGAWHALVLRKDGTVVDWGDAGDGLTNIPPAARHIVAVAAGSWHAVALRADGRVVAWGYNQYYQTNVPASLTNVVAIAASERATYALRSDGTVVSWISPVLGITTPISGLTDAIDIFCPFRPNSLLALRRNGRLVDSGSFTPPSQATNIAAIAGSGESGIALVGTGSPVFPGLPIDRTVVSGARAYFRALATGALPLSYQWQRDGTNILGATNVVLTITNAQPSHMGNYSLVASNAFGLATNGNMVLTVLPVEIIQQPTNRTQSLGGSASFTVTAEGQGPLRYQWLHAGEPVLNATNATLTLTNLQLTEAGPYSVIVSNQHGFELSQVATLTLAPILVTSQPANQTILINSNKTFTVNVTGTAPLDFYWQLNGNPIVATSNSLSLNPATLADAGTYSVTISNAYGSTNVIFSLQVQPSFILAPLINQPAFANGTASFSLPVQTLIPTTYQWLFNDSKIADATNTTLSVSNIQRSQAGNYSIVLSNQFELVTNSAWLALVEVAAWGNNSRQTNVPPNATNLMAIAAGYNHYLALNQQNEIIGWGFNFFNQATHPPGVTNCIAIDAAQNFSVGLKTTGEAFAWGSSSRTNVPSDPSGIVAIASGNAHGLLLTSKGTVLGWGSNSYGETNAPANLSNVVMIAAGQGHSLVLRADGIPVAWGENFYGQTNVPANLSNVVQVAAGGNFSLALKSDGTVLGWGANTYGQTTVPLGVTNVTSIAAGYAHGLALKSDGTVIAWGYNSYGQTNIPTGLTNVIGVAAHPSTYDSLAQIGAGPPTQNAVMVAPVLAAGDFSVSIPSQSGRVYRLEFAATPDAAEWTPLPLIAGNGKTLTLRDTPPTEAQQRYYRVRRW